MTTDPPLLRFVRDIPGTPGAIAAFLDECEDRGIEIPGRNVIPEEFLYKAPTIHFLFLVARIVDECMFECKLSMEWLVDSCGDTLSHLPKCLKITFRSVPYLRSNTVMVWPLGITTHGKGWEENFEAVVHCARGLPGGDILTKTFVSRLTALRERQMTTDRPDPPLISRLHEFRDDLVGVMAFLDECEENDITIPGIEVVPEHWRTRNVVELMLWLANECKQKGLKCSFQPYDQQGRRISIELANEFQGIAIATPLTVSLKKADQELKLVQAGISRLVCDIAAIKCQASDDGCEWRDVSITSWTGGPATICISPTGTS